MQLRNLINNPIPVEDRADLISELIEDQEAEKQIAGEEAFDAKVGAGETAFDSRPVSKEKATYAQTWWYKNLPARHQQIIDRIATKVGGKMVNLISAVYQSHPNDQFDDIPEGAGRYTPLYNDIKYNYNGECVSGNSLEFVIEHELAHVYDVFTGRSLDRALWGASFTESGELANAFGKFAKAAKRLYDSGNVHSLKYPLGNLYDPDGGRDAVDLANAKAANKTPADVNQRGRMEIYAELRAIFSNGGRAEAEYIKQHEPELYAYLEQEQRDAEQFAKDNEAAFSEWHQRQEDAPEAAPPIRRAVEIDQLSILSGRSTNQPAQNLGRPRGLALPEPLEFQQSAIKDQIERTLTTAKDLGKKALHKLVFMHDLVAIAEREGLKSAKGFNDLMGQKDRRCREQNALNNLPDVEVHSY